MSLSWGAEVKPLWSKNTSVEVPLPWNKTTFRVKKKTKQQQQQQQQHCSINLNFLKFKSNTITFRLRQLFFQLADYLQLQSLA